MSVHETVDAIQHARGSFGQNLGEAYAAAIAVTEPAGHTEAWADVCRKWGVSLLGDEERAQIRTGQRPTKGAPVMEFQLVVSAIIQRGRHDLASVRTAAYHYDLDKSFDEVWRMVDGAENDLMATYRGQVLPKRGGMFANVTAHVGSGPAPMAGASGSTLCCRTCGAPQQQATDFMCKYCGNKMV